MEPCDICGGDWFWQTSDAQAVCALCFNAEIPPPKNPCVDLAGTCCHKDKEHGKCGGEVDFYSPDGKPFCLEHWLGQFKQRVKYKQSIGMGYFQAVEETTRENFILRGDEPPTPPTTPTPSPIIREAEEILMPTIAPLNLSHSQLEAWEHCPQKWAFNKVDKILQAPAEALILGTAFHAALEEDGRRKMRGEPAMLDYELFAWFDEHLIAGLKEQDPTDLLKRQQQAMRAKAQLMIKAYVAQVQPHFAPLAVEQDFTYSVGEGVTMRGRIDAITTASIVDWKTASKPWINDAQHGKDQASAYLIAQPKQTRVSFAVFAPDTQNDTCSFQSLATTRTEAQQQEYRGKVLHIASEIRAAKKTGEFKANPGPLCGWCGYLGSCTIGEAWLKTHGRVPAVPVLREKVKAEA